MLGVVGVVTVALGAGGSQFVPPPFPLGLAAAVDFGDREPSAEPADRRVTLSNRGDRAVRVEKVTVGGRHAADFTITVDRCTGQSLAPKSSCEITLGFTPRQLGARQAALDFAVVGEVRTARLSGSGTPRLAKADGAPESGCYLDAYQVGRSAYGYDGGLKAISVKQYWSPSCHASIGYIWIWKQYRDKIGPGTWTVELSARGDKPPLSTREATSPGQPLELWTPPLRVSGGCTVASATLRTVQSAKQVTATTAPHCD